jgi:hypothetical protein
MKDIRKNYEAKYDMEFQYEIMMDKRVRWLQFIGDEILYDDLSPLPFDGFSIVPMFAFKDVSQRTSNHFGIVRLMKDPQREVNKRWSQALNLLNQQVQPGIFAEVEAFLDLDQASTSMKEPGSVTLLNSGGLGKMKERTMPQFPNAPMQMEEFSQGIMRKITGINPDLLGQDRGRQEPGVVVRLRQQQGTTLLKPLFKSYKGMRKQLFRRILTIIMEFMPNEQMLRVMGKNEKYEFDPQAGILVDKETELVADIRDVRNIEYNVTVEEAPGNMTKRTFELSAFMEMQEKGFPVPPEVIIERMDLPASDKKKWLEYINSQQEGQAKQQEEMLAKEIEFKDREISNDEKETIMDFLVAVAKVNQAAEKDEKKLKGTAAQLDQAADQTMLTFLASMAATAVQEKGIDKQGAANEKQQGKQQKK